MSSHHIHHRTRPFITVIVASTAVALMVTGCSSALSSTNDQALVADRAPKGGPVTPPPPFVFTKAVQTVGVPSGVTGATFVLNGGSGGNGTSGSVGRGGYGAVVTGAVPVVAGSTISVAVGGEGGHYGTNPLNNHGGWGDSATGGAGGNAPSSGGDGYGGGGGGATTLTVGGVVVAVAGGGGGGAGGGCMADGGDGGAAGDPAHNGNKGDGPSPGGGGKAGTESTGLGGAGGTAQINDCPGGGGGGGVRGGGAGGAGWGAGGGGGAGTYKLASEVAGGAITSGTALGDGQATLTWSGGTP